MKYTSRRHFMQREGGARAYRPGCIMNTKGYKHVDMYILWKTPNKEHIGDNINTAVLFSFQGSNVY